MQKKVIEFMNGEFVYVLRAGDWVDEDFTRRLTEALRQGQADMVICGVLRVRGKQFKRGNFYEYSKVLEGNAGKWELLKSGYLQYGLCGCVVKAAVWHKISEIADEEQIYAALRACRRIAVLNDYKYYYLEEPGTGFYEECVEPMVMQKDGALYPLLQLEKCYRIYTEYFPKFTQEQIWKLFTRKERLLLCHKGMARVMCRCSSWMQKQRPDIYRVLSRTADLLMERLAKPDGRLEQIFRESDGGKRILILGTPEYHNLGDHAIAYAQERFAQHFFPEYAVLCITEGEITRQLACLKRNIRRDDVLLLQGGGNMGDSYGTIEELRLRMLRSFPKNKIILMPQTIHFSDKPDGKKLKMRMQKIYGGHSRLLLNAREHTSYQRMKEYFPGCRTALCPDIVMSLLIQKELPALRRNGILLLVRTDAEGTLDIEQLMELKNMSLSYSDDVTMTETSLSYGVSQKERREALYAKWTQIAGAELIVTDRLHGMIFAAITATPCIVLANYNHKVAESYEWLGDLEYIQFCIEFRGIKKHFDAAWKKRNNRCEYENANIREYYKQLALSIQEL